MVMEFVMGLIDEVQTRILDLNAATHLSLGAIDIIVVQHVNGTFHSTRFHIRFGKFQLLQLNRTQSRHSSPITDSESTFIICGVVLV